MVITDERPALVNVLDFLAYALLFVVVLAVTFGPMYRWLEFGAGLRRSTAVALALVVGIAAGAGVCWLTLPDPATIAECVDFTPDPSGRC